MMCANTDLLHKIMRSPSPSRLYYSTHSIVVFSNGLQDRRIKTAYSAAVRSTDAGKGTPLDTLNNFERKARALVKVIMANGGGGAR